MPNVSIRDTGLVLVPVSIRDTGLVLVPVRRPEQLSLLETLGPSHVRVRMGAVLSVVLAMAWHRCPVDTPPEIYPALIRGLARTKSCFSRG